MVKRIKLNKGQRFGKLIVVGDGNPFIQPSGQRQRGIICKCDCGTVKTIRLSHLIRNRISSCGCDKHGDCGSKLHNTWRGMMNRVRGNGNRAHRYKKRGITVCESWLKYKNFRAWALLNGWRHGLQIDRKNNGLGYSPNNCRWVTNIINVNNRDNTFKVKYHNKEFAFMILLRKKKLINHHHAIRLRIKNGWSVERAIETPIRKLNNVSTRDYEYANS